MAQAGGPSCSKCQAGSPKTNSSAGTNFNIVSKRQVFCRQLIGESLSTHDDLKLDDIMYALEVDCSKLSDEQLAILAVHLCKNTDIGRFSLIYNFEVDMAIIKRNRERWIELLQINHKLAFPEFYDQLDKFTQTEKETITRIHTREYNAAFQLTKNAQQMSIPYLQYLIEPCPRLKDTTKFSASGTFDPAQIKQLESSLVSSPFQDGMVMTDGRKKVTLYQQCYQGVCIKEETVLDMKFISSADLSDDNITIPAVIGAGEGEASLTAAQCFKMITLIHAISQEPAINPLTGEPFDPRILNLVQTRFSKETKLYKYFYQMITSFYS